MSGVMLGFVLPITVLTLAVLWTRQRVAVPRDGS